MKQSSIRRTPLYTGIAFALVASVNTSLYAQDQEDDADGVLEEVVVTGIRSSLMQSMDLKRDSDGVVDALVAEDIGKFPDTNLAEALQRITGVSIDRGTQGLGAQGEGQRITVRGIGGDFNLVLLNGRQMPTTSLNGTSLSTSRAFDFSNLASEAVSAVEVYKTSIATIPTGGIGATVNIRTARPLETGDRAISLGAKAVHDTSDQDNAWTPEISGIYQDTFADGTFGIALSAIYQEREFGYNQAGTTSGWIPENRLDPSWQALPAPGAPGSENYVNLPGDSDLYSLPQNLAYALNDVDRERLNGQLVLQWAPTDRLTFTLDYTYSELEVETRRNDLSVWFIQCGVCGSSTGTFTDGPIVTPLEWSETWAGRDIGHGGAQSGWKTELDSIGFNGEWLASDSLTFHLDVHSSTSESGRTSKFGSDAVLGGVLFTSGGRATVNYSQDLPVLMMDLLPGEFDASNILTGGASFRSAYNKMDIDQIDLGGVWDFNDTNSLDFGVTATDVNNRSAFRNVQYDNWGGIGSPDDYPDDLFVLRDVTSLFDQVPGNGAPGFWDQMYTWDFAAVAAAREAATGQSMAASDAFDNDIRTEEESLSAYLQWRSNFDMFGMNSNLRLGVRYEQTDVSSSALVPIPVNILWVAANEYSITFGEQDFTQLEGDYDYVLPNLDLSVNVTDNFIVRGSYTQSIGRPDWQSIQGGQTLNGLVRRDFGNGSQGNPGLKPLESDNYDLSFEWYYGEGSYASVAYFYKDTSNYIGFSQIEGTPFNLPHPGNGQWYDECNASTGGGNDQTAIRQCIFETYGDSPFVNITGVDSNGNFTGTIEGQAGQDPAANFIISVPSNQRDATIDGWEIAIQHIFGESGFGVSANYTMVDSDIAYDNASVDDQFAILGLSDSANLVAFYDKNGLIARLAYNWRDEFLTGTADGNGIANPVYVEEYGQLDAIVSYEFENGLIVFAEGFNLTDEYSRSFSRRPEQLEYVTQLGPRYGVGVRWNF